MSSAQKNTPGGDESNPSPPGDPGCARDQPTTWTVASALVLVMPVASVMTQR